MNSNQTIEKYIDILLSEDIHSLIIRGSPGTGKTTTVLNKVKSYGLEEDRHFRYFNGYITPLRLYKVLSGCSVMEQPVLFIFDDIDSLLQNKTSLAILKGALAEARGKRIVSYESSTKTADTRSFEFNGKVIIVLNSLSTGKAVESLIDRGILCDIDNNAQETIAYIEENLDSFGGDMPMAEKYPVWEKIRRFAGASGFSLRAVERAFTFYKHDKDNWYSLFKKNIDRK